jgi:predicted nucleic acid-binding protein
VAPDLLFFEVRNVLLVNERRARLTEAQSREFLRALSRLPIRVDRSADEAQLMVLARRHRLTAYAAAYLELALREGLPLATLDAKLEAAMRAADVRPWRA